MHFGTAIAVASIAFNVVVFLILVNGNHPFGDSACIFWDVIL